MQKRPSNILFHKPVIPMALLMGAALMAVAGCAGGNPIDDAVPTAAAIGQPAEFPPPSEPGALTATATAAQEFPQPPTATPPPVPAFDPAEAVSSGAPRDTGTFPTVNTEPPPATNQMTDAERARLLAEMNALRNQHERGQVDTEAYRKRLLYLQQLARNHSKDKIRQIEAR